MMSQETLGSVGAQSLSHEFFSSMIDKDRKSDNWFLLRTPYPVAVVVLVYLLVIFKVGPAFMKGRDPYELKWVMRIYNILQVILNARLLSYPLITYGAYIPYFFEKSCIPLTENDDHIDELRDQYMTLFWYYLVLKMIDLADTVFMVLRKKYDHVTFLHVYHHSVMVLCCWFTLKYIKPVQLVIPGMINIAIHVIMYSYYFLATFGPSMEKYLRWKRHLTKLQLAQFVFVLVYLFALYYNGCQVSTQFTVMWLSNIFVILCLFVNFYVRAYILRRGQMKKGKTD